MDNDDKFWNEQQLIDHINSLPQLPDRVLPELTEHQGFYCTFCDKLDITPERYWQQAIAYKEGDYKDAKVLAEQGGWSYRSSCCQDEAFGIYDRRTGNDVPWPKQEQQGELEV